MLTSLSRKADVGRAGILIVAIHCLTDALAGLAQVKRGTEAPVIAGNAVALGLNYAQTGIGLTVGFLALLHGRPGAVDDAGRIILAPGVHALEQPVAQVAVVQLDTVRIGMALANELPRLAVSVYAFVPGRARLPVVARALVVCP